MIKALACDIDGTLTDRKRRLDLDVVRLVRKIEGLGVPVVLATGNVLCLTEAASIYIGTTGPLIAENGGIIKDSRTGEVRFFCDVETMEVKEAYDHLKDVLPVRKVAGSELRKTEIAIYRDFPIEEIRKVLNGFKVRVVDTKFAIHIIDPRVNKGEGLSAVSKIMGLDINEFASIGDSENDYEMLNKSGLSIGIGEESLEKASTFVTRESYAKGGISALKFVLKKIKERG